MTMSCLLSAPLLAPLCSFECLYVVSDPLESTRPCFCLYPRVADIIQGTHDHAATLAKRMKSLSLILQKKKKTTTKKQRLQSVADEPEFTSPQVLNPDFSSLTGVLVVSFFELEWMEGCAKALLEVNSFSLWLMSNLLSQLKLDGFKPSNPTLFDSAI